MPRSRRRIKARPRTGRPRAPAVVQITDIGRGMVARGIQTAGVSDAAKVAILVAAQIADPISRENLAAVVSRIIDLCDGNAAVAAELIEAGFLRVSWAKQKDHSE